MKQFFLILIGVLVGAGILAAIMWAPGLDVFRTRQRYYEVKQTLTVTTSDSTLMVKDVQAGATVEGSVNNRDRWLVDIQVRDPIGNTVVSERVSPSARWDFSFEAPTGGTYFFSFRIAFAAVISGAPPPSCEVDLYLRFPR